MGPLENLAAAGDLLASLTNIFASLEIFGDTRNTLKDIQLCVNRYKYDYRKLLIMMLIVPVRKQSLLYNLNHIDTDTQIF